MYALDFEYDGQHLSDFGFIICDFDYTAGANTATAGSKLEFNKVSRHRGKKYSLTNAKYSECIVTDFDICKNPDVYDDLLITDDEYRDLVRWLNRSEFLKFQVVKEESIEGDHCWYEASFNIEKIKIAERLYGLSLTMETNAPFGYGEEVRFAFDNGEFNKVITFYDLSDEIGNIYPDVTITCKLDGDIAISNTVTGCNMEIRNCSAGEVISITGDKHIVSTSNSNHDICKDFNYDYFSIGNTYLSRENNISISVPCYIELRYDPIIKDTP